MKSLLFVILVLHMLVASIFAVETITHWDVKPNEHNEVNNYGCGQRIKDFIDQRDENGKIVGGAVAQLGDFCWQYMLRLNGSYICGGSIINPCWGVTSAHCIITEYVDNVFKFFIIYLKYHRYNKMMIFAMKIF